MSDLKPLSPEPASPDELPLHGVPPTPSSKRFTSTLIPVLEITQQVSTIPLSLFAVVHAAGVVVAPALAGVDIAEQLVSLGRELYQVPALEKTLLGSVTVHIFSGIALRVLRKYNQYLKYGTSKKKKHPTTTINPLGKNKEEVVDKDKGLGGISSLLGLGPRKSWSSRFLGLSPLSFSGYLLVFVLGYHVLQQRVSPLLVDGDSSFIDLSYVTYALSLNPLKTSVGLVFLVSLTSYHIIGGTMRYLRMFSLGARKRAYGMITLMTALAAAAVFNLSRADLPIGGVVARFDRYLGKR